MITHFEDLYAPIAQMNEVLLKASVVARNTPGMVIAGQMLNHLRVSAIGHNFLVLRSTKPYLINAMIKRQDKILQAIQLVVPEVTEISIIEAQGE